MQENETLQDQLFSVLKKAEELILKLDSVQRDLLIDNGIGASGYKERYSHRDFVLRLGDSYTPIMRVRDENAALPPATKNYALARMFELWGLADWIDLLDPDLHSAFGEFVAMGVMTQDEADRILTPNEIQ